MLGSDNAGPGARNMVDLIRDIGRSGHKPGGAVESEQQLMRIAGDPLLVREYMLKGEPYGLEIQCASHLQGEATIALARIMLAHGSLEGAYGSPKLRQYERREPLLENFDAVSRFRPTHEDRVGALEENKEPAKKAGPCAAGGLAAVIWSLAVILLLVLIVVLLIPT